MKITLSIVACLIVCASAGVNRHHSGEKPFGAYHAGGFPAPYGVAQPPPLAGLLALGAANGFPILHQIASALSQIKNLPTAAPVVPVVPVTATPVTAAPVPVAPTAAPTLFPVQTTPTPTAG